MMINELPQTYEGIAETFFENPDDRSQFRKVMLNNMKESTGVDPDITNEAIAETLNEDRDKDLYQGIEKGLMINPSDPETRKNMLSNMEVIGKLSRVYPNTAIEELFSEDYLSRKIATDDVFLINATNTNTDYPVYITRWNLFATRLLDRLNQDDPSLWSIAKRAVTPMVLGAIESVGKKAVGKTFLAHGLTAAYDVSQLGNSIYNTQRDFNKRLRDIMDNKDLDAEQYVQEIEGLLDDVQKVPEEYRYEIYNSLWSGPNLYADSGLSFTGLGPMGIIHGMSSLKANITRYLPSFSSQNVKHLVLNDELGQKIVDLATNSSNEEKAIEKVTAKITESQPKDAPESEVAVAKGIAINEDTDKNLRLNSNKDSGFFDRLVRGLSNLGEKSDQRGEIRLDRPEQNYYIDHGKGVDNDPMTYEEAVRLMNKLQGRKRNVLYRERFIRESDIEDVPEYVAVSTASKAPWESLHVEYKPGTGEGTQAYGGGMYATFVDSDWEASRESYFKNAQEKSDKAVLNTHYIPNPEKHPEMYLYYDAEDPGIRPFAINMLNEYSDKYYKIAEKQQKIIRSAVKDIEEGLQKRIQKAIKDGDTKIVDDLQFDHKFLLDHYNGDMSVFSWSDYLRENVYGLDKPSGDFRRWEKEYWKDKGIKGLVHEGEGSTATNVVIFDESITSPVTKVETKDTQTGYNNAHMIVSAGDGVGYFVRELHGVEDAKPMLVKSGKIVDKGDYKEYNPKK